MNIAIIGATGNVGSRLVQEALARGHHVTAIARHASGLEARPHLDTLDLDLADSARLADALRGKDAVISSVRFASTPLAAVLGPVKQAAVRRLLVVGGAGSLEVAPGAALVDTPAFPAEYKPEALAGRDWLNALRTEKDLDWTFLSPSALFVPGERTGTFRLGGDTLLTAADGRSWISMEDFAVAMLDEAAQPAHSRRRFTVGY
ncbi:NAD(P)-dependent oxidoreductase [Pigmentiphaga sp.]|uniref:NAD(P)-dependent oxidoreductase n=1 Tax=Pigmentiphaga sp. TaxID=1977564 RepID=UPI00128AECFA|nr:NAD(P)-dependent oxidoreductase [Pigmentiphaga sp.]MPS29345.1 NAD(P)-dependent oxidoreductase [Alcaligenaceae bacterium SAGV5]MPS55347.1 NAD(P)-dependent oxidoreductase [Alcaligenaceae bacterium SAGV3]MPT56558.1 NAD(P)-dependent oxidoreductase [Alcaligenaceae bacterium]